jgi:hypothetical protein
VIDAGAVPLPNGQRVVFRDFAGLLWAEPKRWGLSQQRPAQRDSR